jgi:hypothetical protein
MSLDLVGIIAEAYPDRLPASFEFISSKSIGVRRLDQ